jgi:hypothetical protein
MTVHGFDQHMMSWLMATYGISSICYSIARKGDFCRFNNKCDATSVDFGLEKMNVRARGPDLFDVENFPTATYRSSSIDFDGDTPMGVHGSLTLHGVTKLVFLTIASFKCIIHPMLKPKLAELTPEPKLIAPSSA